MSNQLPQAPLPCTWWVEPHLLAGQFPGDLDEATSFGKLQTLLEAGVRFFVNLQGLNEVGLAGEDFVDYFAQAKKLAKTMGIEVEQRRFPVPNMSVTTIPKMQEILAAIDTAINAEKTVYLHCWGGHGRTGTVVGCRMREQGIPAEVIFARITKLRQHDSRLQYFKSPQTAEQRKMVEEWPSNLD